MLPKRYSTGDSNAWIFQIAWKQFYKIGEVAKQYHSNKKATKENQVCTRLATLKKKNCCILTLQYQDATIFFSMGPILFLYYEESLVSSNLNSKLFSFHCVRSTVHTSYLASRFKLTIWYWWGSVLMLTDKDGFLVRTRHL